MEIADCDIIISFNTLFVFFIMFLVVYEVVATAGEFGEALTVHTTQPAWLLASGGKLDQ